MSVVIDKTIPTISLGNVQINLHSNPSANYSVPADVYYFTFVNVKPEGFPLRTFSMPSSILSVTTDAPTTSFTILNPESIQYNPNYIILLLISNDGKTWHPVYFWNPLSDRSNPIVKSPTGGLYYLNPTNNQGVFPTLSIIFPSRGGTSIWIWIIIVILLLLSISSSVYFVYKRKH